MGTQEEIQVQQAVIARLEDQVMAAKLRLRALRGEPLMQVGDSMSSAVLGETMTALEREFGARNLRLF